MKHDANHRARGIDEILCVYRDNVGRRDGAETATCGLLRQITGADAASCTVDRSACESCSESFPSPGARLNPVIPSLLFQICEAEMAGGVSMPHRDRLVRLQAWAAQNVNRPVHERAVTHGCDVIVCCTESTPEAARAVESALAQEGVVPVVHLIDDGGGAHELLGRFEHHAQVKIHRNAVPKGAFATLHDLVPQLRTSYVAIQDAATISRRDRLATVVTQLEERGGEIAGSALSHDGGIFDAVMPTREYQRSLPPETLVVRRATLVDMGGFGDRPHDAGAEFVFRAGLENRKIIASPLPLVARPGEWVPHRIDLAPEYVETDGSLRQHARGFPMPSVACDVVLPFYERPEWVHAAVESVVQQQQADVVVHLIDDAGLCGTEVFQRWKGHPAVRMYRNSENIGPFASFNNVVGRFETDLAAVQDADDVSLPHRLHRAGNLLYLSDSDVFGGGIEVFGVDVPVDTPVDISVDTSTGTRNGQNGDLTSGSQTNIRRSRYPFTGVRYFLENPTAMFRVSAFRQLGGYANFGQPLRNRTGVDTELFARAYYAGLRFAISNDVVLRYRRHPNSATQDPATRVGSQARSEASAERDRRIGLFQTGGWFDPRIFGAFHDFQGVTQRLSRNGVTLS